MRCGSCGADNPGTAAVCPQCGRRIPRSRRHNHAAEGEDTYGPPLPRNTLALYAYRLAVVGLIPLLGLVLGPLALVQGIRGLHRSRVDPPARGGPQAKAGIVLGALELLTNSVGLFLITSR